MCREKREKMSVYFIQRQGMMMHFPGEGKEEDEINGGKDSERLLHIFLLSFRKSMLPLDEVPRIDTRHRRTWCLT